MKTEEHELVRIKNTQFVEMDYDIDNKTLYVSIVEKTQRGQIVKVVSIPINKIPQVIRGLFSAYQRFHRR